MGNIVKSLVTIVFLVVAAVSWASDVSTYTLELTPEQWESIGDPRWLEDDVIVLQDGTKVWGEFEHLPNIVYPFGYVSFDVDEVAAISFPDIMSTRKMQYVTHNGQNYVGEIPSGGMKFLERRPVENPRMFKSKWHYVPTTIQVDSISFILLKKRERVDFLVGDNILSMVMVSGDRFPFTIDTYRINLAEGNNKFSILTKEIKDVWVAGGLQGYLKGVGLDRELEFATLLDKTFIVRLAKNDEVLEIPWKDIARIKNDMGKLILSLPFPSDRNLLIVPREKMIFIPPGKFILGTNVTSTESVDDVPNLKSQRKVSPYTTAQYIDQGNFIPTIERPGVMVSLPGFYIDEYEVTNAEYMNFVKATNHPYPVYWLEGKIPQGMGNHPVVNVSYNDAAAYASWAGKRLPTEVEWERAAKGVSGYPYPYGPNYLSSMANTMSGGTMPVGSFKSFITTQKYNPRNFQAAVQDMSGNVAEWTSTTYAPEWYSQIVAMREYIDPNHRDHSPFKVVRGGSFRSSAETSTTTYRAFMAEDDFNDSTGFRCVADD